MKCEECGGRVRHSMSYEIGGANPYYFMCTKCRKLKRDNLVLEAIDKLEEKIKTLVSGMHNKNLYFGERP